MNSDFIEEKIFSAINDFNMIKNGSNVVVGLSGGKDSVLLLYFLIKISTKFNLKIIAAHVNHNLRGNESFRDENFVKSLCDSYNIKLKILSVYIKSEAEKLGLGIEECGRKVRYDFFEKLANKYNAKIALAHTLSDSMETMLLNLTRGTGIHGLCGIAPVRDNIIRPLIYLSSDEVRFYCKKESLRFVEDSTNAIDDYTRNKIRLNIIPQFKKINPSLEKSFLNAITLLKQDDDFLNKLAKNKLLNAKIEDNQYDILKLKKLDISILQRCIKLAFFETVGYKHLSLKHVKLVHDIIFAGEGTVTLPNETFAKVNNNVLKFFYKSKKNENLWSFPFSKNSKNLTYCDLNVIIKIIDKDEYDGIVKSNDLIKKIAVDYDKIPDNLVFRNRRAGDKFYLPYRKVTKSLKKFFNEEKVLTELRDEIILLAQDDKILWIESFGANENLKVTKNTKKVMLINFNKKL